DSKGCFDHINHAAILRKLQTYPTMRRYIQSCLKAGVMEGLDLTLEDNMPLTTPGSFKSWNSEARCLIYLPACERDCSRHLLVACSSGHIPQRPRLVDKVRGIEYLYTGMLPAVKWCHNRRLLPWLAALGKGHLRVIKPESQVI